MKSKTDILVIALGLAVLWGTTEPVLANPLPQEPGDEYLVDEGVDHLVGFYYKEYSLAQNGIVDYRTARQILISHYDPQQEKSVVQTKEHPLFYWYDGNQDGQFEMWIDRNVEGCPCDIVRYRAAVPSR